MQDVTPSTQYLEADEFACLVLTAEGMDAEIEVQWRRKIRNIFTERFGKEIRANNFRNSF